MSRIPNPAMATSIGMMVNRKRWRNLSERYAMSMEKPNEAAQGGME